VPTPRKLLTLSASAPVSDTVDATPATQITVTVFDATGQPRVGFAPPIIANASVVTLGGFAATPVPFSPKTDANGKATFLLHLGAYPGAYLLIANDGVATFDTLAFTVLPGQPARVTMPTHDTAATIGHTVSLKAIARDRHGNVATGASTLTYSVDSGTATTIASDGTVSAATYGRARLRATLIANGAADTARVAVVPAGVIAYTVDYGSDHPGIATVNIDGSGFRLLAPGLNGDPSWSPDGNTIAYAFDAGSDDGVNGAIYSVDTNGNSTKLFTGPAGTKATRPTYSADASTIFFASGEYPSVDVYRMPSSGSATPALVSPAHAGGNGYWNASPSTDGTLLTYVQAGGALHVYSLATKIDRFIPGAADAPRFSPDGTWISYIDPTTFTLRLIHPDGTGERPLSPVGATVAGLHDWSPDSQWIVCSLYYHEDNEPPLKIIRVSDGLVIQLPSNIDNNSPAWKPR
jgi:hypothetical protein